MTVPTASSRSRLVRLATSTLLSQAAGLLTTGVAATQLPPRTFAVYGFGLALAGVLNSINTWGVESRIPVVNEDDLSGFVRAGLCTLSIVTLGAGVIVLTVVVIVARGLAAVTALGVLLSAVMGLQSLGTALAIRFEDDGALARARLVQGPANLVFVCVGLLSPLPGGELLTTAFLLANVCSLWVLVQPQVKRGIWRVALRTDAASGERGRLWAARAVRSQPLAQFLAGVCFNAPLLALPLLASTTLAASWAFLARLYAPAFNLSLSTVQPVLVGSLATQLRNSDYAATSAAHRRWVLRLVALACALVAAISVAIVIFTRATHSELAVQSWRYLLPASVYWFSLIAAWPTYQVLSMISAYQSQLRVYCLRFALITLGLLPAAYGSDSGWAGWTIATASLASMAALIAAQRQALLSTAVRFRGTDMPEESR